MSRKSKRVTHEELCLRLIDAAEPKGITPEKCGELISDATAVPTPPGWDEQSREFWKAECDRRASARRQISELIGARDMVLLCMLERDLLSVR